MQQLIQAVAVADYVIVTDYVIDLRSTDFVVAVTDLCSSEPSQTTSERDYFYVCNLGLKVA